LTNDYLQYTATLEELIKHALLALRETTQASEGLTFKNCSVGIVGLNHKFEILEESKLTPYVSFSPLICFTYYFLNFIS
jgi:20S proteasome subunit alpha 6